MIGECSSSAARETDRWRAQASKACKAAMGGVWRRIGNVRLHSNPS